MHLTVLYLDGTSFEINVRRVSNISSKIDSDKLYYECSFHLPGKGCVIPLSDILCWEVRTTVI